MVFRLHHNMHLSQPVDFSIDVNRISQCASWLLDIGNGNIETPERNDLERNNIIQIPQCFYIELRDKGLESLIHFLYRNDLSVRAIICPENETVYQLNSLILSKTSGQEVYLNNLYFSSIPSHSLLLKVKTTVMLLRNINKKDGLCNGMHLIVTQLLPSIMEASIITRTSGVHSKKKFVHNNYDLPFIFTRKQFPIKVCYAMTINKNQAQCLKKVGLYLVKSVFTHTQLCVDLFRATTPDSIKIMLQQEDVLSLNCFKNVVFKDLLARVKKQEVITPHLCFRNI
uniref:DNA helicase Pif1-like 2B domain-containing protein n=1 Tax=Lactuca sativa TaxID=4236 RepID=A0A9R1VXY3_LACSA|nr:hypothetical protein LSAT_V11C400161090 [Lactuca sativa]